MCAFFFRLKEKNIEFLLSMHMMLNNDFLPNSNVRKEESHCFRNNIGLYIFIRVKFMCIMFACETKKKFRSP
jgi:hypothetical protein